MGMDDPRFLSLTNQMNNCLLRFTMFTRCARELGEEDVRCKYQYYRAQCNCHESFLEDWMEHRARGSCHMDVLPDRSTVNCRQCSEGDLGLVWHSTSAEHGRLHRSITALVV